MGWYPIAFIIPQYEDSTGKPYSGAVLKFYEAGTTTVLPIAPTFAGLATVTSMQLNSNGNPTYLGAAVIPHLTKDYKVSLYPTQAAADSNTGAIWTYDDVKITGAGTAGSIVSVASAATIDLNSNLTNYFLITGANPISNITLADGSEVVVRFAGVLTINNGAFLLNIGAGVIVTEAGDIAVFRGEASGVVRMMSYTRASGELLNLATFAEVLSGAADKLIPASVGQQMVGRVLLATYTPSGVGSVNITGVLSALYNTYEIEFNNIAIAVDGNDLCLRTSTNNGSTWDSGASDYIWSLGYAPTSGGGVTNSGDNTAVAVRLNQSQGNAANEDSTGIITIQNVNSTTVQKVMTFINAYTSAAGSAAVLFGFGRRLSTADIDAIQILPLTGADAAGGNIVSGIVRVYGIRK